MVLTEVADFRGILAMDTTPAAAVASSPANFRQVKLRVTLGDVQNPPNPLCKGGEGDFVPMIVSLPKHEPSLSRQCPRNPEKVLVDPRKGLGPVD